MKLSIILGQALSPIRALSSRYQFVMARKTLLNIGRRAEAVAAGKANPAFNN